tara:strand:+ start:222 stop:620 length:399 start_codon:yes stop_codon:yes gene_type:complete
MIAKNRRSVQDLLDEANSQIETISIEKAKNCATDEKYVFVDLRDIRELRKSGKIPKAFSCPRGMLEFWIDTESPYHKEIFSQEKTFVFYCASGWRSALSTKTASDMGLENVCHIEGGFNAWVKNGGEVENLD